MNHHNPESGVMQDSAYTPQETSPQNEGLAPQTYEQWKRQHGYKPVDEPRLELGQRVKAARDLDDEDTADDFWYEWQSMYGADVEPPAYFVDYVNEGMLGTVTAYHEREYRTYEIRFDNGVVFWCSYLPDLDADENEIVPVGKSPSQIAADKAEAKRLSQWQQLPLFTAATRESVESGRESEAGK